MQIRKLLTTAILLLAVFGVIGGASGKSKSGPKSGTPKGHANSDRSTTEIALGKAMRKLWEDHITWTRVFLISAAADLPDKSAATERLLQNQVDIGRSEERRVGKECRCRG